jgi:hypothetical protein
LEEETRLPSGIDPSQPVHSENEGILGGHIADDQGMVLP